MNEPAQIYVYFSKPYWTSICLPDNVLLIDAALKAGSRLWLAGLLGSLHRGRDRDQPTTPIAIVALFCFTVLSIDSHNITGLQINSCSDSVSQLPLKRPPLDARLWSPDCRQQSQPEKNNARACKIDTPLQRQTSATETRPRICSLLPIRWKATERVPSTPKDQEKVKVWRSLVLLTIVLEATFFRT